MKVKHLNKLICMTPPEHETCNVTIWTKSGVIEVSMDYIELLRRFGDNKLMYFSFEKREYMVSDEMALEELYLNSYLNANADIYMADNVDIAFLDEIGNYSSTSLRYLDLKRLFGKYEIINVYKGQILLQGRSKQQWHLGNTFY